MTVAVNAKKIDALAEDFERFRSNKTLGVEFVPNFEDTAYGNAIEAFSQAWIRGLRWGWAKNHLEASHRANQRMRNAFSLFYPPGHSASTIRDEPGQVGLPKQTDLDLKWFNEVIVHILQCHFKVWGHVHAAQDKSEDSKIWAAYFLYRDIMRVAWQHGWNAGVDRAETLHQDREKELGTYSRFESEAMAIEQDALARRAISVFNLTDDEAKRAREQIEKSLSRISPKG